MIKINLKKINFDDILEKIKVFLLKHKLIVTSFSIVALLACISILISYAYYKVTETDVVIGSTVGQIPDIDIRIMVENRNDEGKPLGTYSEYPYVPQAGYEYNEKLSYCTQGSELILGDDYSLTVDTDGTELCFAYFDATENLDINLEVYIQEVDETGKGLTGSDGKKIYHIITSKEMPTGYKLNQTDSSCSTGTLSYNTKDNKFIIISPGKTFCRAYMDAVEPDILLKVFLQKSPGVSNTIDDYYSIAADEKIPTNMYYEFSKTQGLESSCNAGGSMKLENQNILVTSSQKTICTAYLDIVTGPIVKEASLTINNNNAEVFLASSPISNEITKWYYSTGGDYVELTDGKIANIGDQKIAIYGVDANGHDSAIIELDKEHDYYFNETFTKDTVNEFTVRKNGYYYLQVWGASEDKTTTAGGYADGYIYLNQNDQVYLTIGLMPKGETNIKIKANNDNNRVIIVSENMTYIYDQEHLANYPGSPVLKEQYYLTNSHIYRNYEEFPSPTGALIEGYYGDGYVQISYVGPTLN